MGVRGRHSLRRIARLKRRTWIRPLFDRKRTDVISVSHGCIRLLVRRVQPVGEDSARLFVGFAANRGVRKAVLRNRVKRLLRESFRLNQGILQEHMPPTGAVTMMILYRNGDLKSFAEVNADLRRALVAAADKLDEVLKHG